MNKVSTLICCLALVVSATAEAAVIYTGGQISQVTNVAVTAANANWGSTGPSDPRTVVFDVDFIYGTYAEVFGGNALPAGWEFTSASLATAGTYALADALTGEPGSAVFLGGSIEPRLAYYIGEVSGAVGSCPNCALARSVYYWPSPHTVGWEEGFYTSTIQPNAQHAWAIYTRATIEPSGSVPLPATAWLMLIGLLTLVTVARRR